MLKKKLCTCGATLRDTPFPDGNYCPSGCGMESVMGEFELEGYTFKFDYRTRLIKGIYNAKGERVRVSMDFFNEGFNKMKRLCGEERRTNTGPFWGPGGVLERARIKRGTND